MANENYKIKHETLDSIADAIRAKTGITDSIFVADFATKISEIETEPDLQSKTVTYTGNGTYTVDNDSNYDGLDQVTVTVNVNTSCDHTFTTKSITENGSYAASNDNASGYSSVTVNVQPDLQAKTASPSATKQIISPDNAYDGLSQVTINPCTGNKSITSISAVDVAGYATAQVSDSDLVAANIKKGINILGVAGSYEGEEPQLQPKTVSPKGTSQTVTADSGYDGLSQVTVNACEGTEFVTTTSPVNVVGKAYAKVADSYLKTENIKSGVSILGVEGSYTGEVPKLDDLELTITENGYLNPQISSPDEYIGWGNVKLNVGVYEAPIEANKVSVRLYNGMGLDDIIGYIIGTTPIMGRGLNASEPLHWGVASNLEYVNAGISIGQYSEYFSAFAGSKICVATGYGIKSYTVPEGGGTITVL